MTSSLRTRLIKPSTSSLSEFMSSSVCNTSDVPPLFSVWKYTGKIADDSSAISSLSSYSSMAPSCASTPLRNFRRACRLSSLASTFTGTSSVCFSTAIESAAPSLDSSAGASLSPTASAVLLLDSNSTGVSLSTSASTGSLSLIKSLCGVDSGADAASSSLSSRAFANAAASVFSHARSICCSLLYCFFFSYNSFPAICTSFSSLTSAAKSSNDIPNTDLSRASIVSRFTWSSFAPSAASFERAARVATPIASKHAPAPSAAKTRHRFAIHRELCFVVCGVSASANNPARSPSDMIARRPPTPTRRRVDARRAVRSRLGFFLVSSRLARVDRRARACVRFGEFLKRVLEPKSRDGCLNNERRNIT